MATCILRHKWHRTRGNCRRCPPAPTRDPGPRDRRRRFQEGRAAPTRSVRGCPGSSASARPLKADHGGEMSPSQSGALGSVPHLAVPSEAAGARLSRCVAFQGHPTNREKGGEMSSVRNTNWSPGGPWAGTGAEVPQLGRGDRDGKWGDGSSRQALKTQNQVCFSCPPCGC